MFKKVRSYKVRNKLLLLTITLIFVTYSLSGIWKSLTEKWWLEPILLMHQLPRKILLTSKVVKSCSKIIFLFQTLSCDRLKWLIWNIFRLFFSIAIFKCLMKLFWNWKVYIHLTIASVVRGLGLRGFHCASWPLNLDLISSRPSFFYRIF